MKNLNRIIQLSGVLSCLILLSACASYKAGAGANLPFKKIYVQPVINNSFAPQTQALLTHQLGQAFLRDGRATLVGNPEQADAQLVITLTDYKRSPAAHSATDTARARSFSLSLTAECDLYDLRKNKAYFKKREVAADIGTFTDSGSQPSEYQDLPVLARQLAQRIVDKCLNTW